MKSCLVAILFFPLLSVGQGTPLGSPQATKLAYYVALYSQSEGLGPTNVGEVVNFADKLEAKQSSFKHSKDFLSYLFDKTHRRFLKHYVQYVSFGEMLNESRYNCLTATALYALLLDRFDVDYQIIETNYHIFLLAETAEGHVLLETTDAVNGFIDDANAIEKRIAQYRQNDIQQARSTKTYYKYNTDVYNEVNLDEMLGLMHYNLAIVAYNEQKLEIAIQQLGKAMDLYRSPRIEEFSQIILLTVIESKLEASARDRYLQGIQSIRKKHLNLTARTN